MLDKNKFHRFSLFFTPNNIGAFVSSHFNAQGILLLKIWKLVSTQEE